MPHFECTELAKLLAVMQPCAPAPTIYQPLNHLLSHCLPLLPVYAMPHLLCKSEVCPRSTSSLPCA